MTTTTSYGTWCNQVDPRNVSVEGGVADVFGSEGTDGFDFDAIVADYREAINAALPSGVALTGDEFIGPYYAADCRFDGYPADPEGELDLKAIVVEVDLTEILERHAVGA